MRDFLTGFTKIPPLFASCVAKNTRGGYEEKYVLLQTLINLFDLSTLAECWRQTRQEWVVYRTVVRYYPKKNSHSKVVEEWDAARLSALKESNWWHHPRIQSVDEIKNFIGLFWDTGSASGFVEADPEYNQSGYATLVEEFSYRVLVPGDKEEALASAKARLQQLEAEV